MIAVTGKHVSAVPAVACIGSFLWAVACGFVLTRVVRRVAVDRGWVSLPSSDRHLHVDPVPRLGGVAIYFTVITTAATLAAAAHLFHFNPGFDPVTALHIFIPATMIFLVGLYDDILTVSAEFKFSVQVLAAVVLYLFNLRVYQVPLLFGLHGFRWAFALPLTILWVLWITNAFNLMDGIDGLSAGSALFSTLTVFIVALAVDSPIVAMLTILGGAILGFLRFNFNPATIFLGDSGSLFIGFLLSALAIAGTQKAPTIVAVAIPIVSFGLPIFETGLSVVRRFLSGRPLFGADREHIHHKLLERGLSQKQVVVVLYAVSAAFGLLSLLLLNFGGRVIGIVLIVAGTGIWMAVGRLGYHEFFELRSLGQRTMAQRRAIINNLAIRRAVSKLAHTKSLDAISAVLDSAFRDNDFGRYELLVYTVPAHEGCASFSLQDDGALLHRYCRQSASVDDTPLWSLTIHLRDAGMELGRLELFSTGESERPHIDLGLLTTEFQNGVALAVARSFTQTAQAPHKAFAAAAAASGVSGLS